MSQVDTTDKPASRLRKLFKRGSKEKKEPEVGLKKASTSLGFGESRSTLSGPKNAAPTRFLAHALSPIPKALSNSSPASTSLGPTSESATLLKPQGAPATLPATSEGVSPVTPEKTIPESEVPAVVIPTTVGADSTLSVMAKPLLVPTTGVEETGSGGVRGRSYTAGTQPPPYPVPKPTPSRTALGLIAGSRIALSKTSVLGRVPGTSAALPRATTIAHATAFVPNPVKRKPSSSNMFVPPSRTASLIYPSRTPTADHTRTISALPRGEGHYSSNNSSLGLSRTSTFNHQGEAHSSLLVLPVAHPNVYLPSGCQQSTDDLFDAYALPDKGSAKDRNLGGGASSDVRTVIHKTSRRLYALKRFCKVLNELDDEFYERAAKEYLIGKRLAQGVHVVGLLGLFKFPTTGNLQRSWGMVLDLCEGGDLFSLILRPGFRTLTPLPEKYCLFKQIAYGLQFLHLKGIVHRDLKPENVLLTRQGIIKLTDFGVSDYGNVEEGNVSLEMKRYTQFVGSAPYLPPEVMQLKGVALAKRSSYDPYAMDMWGLGMLLFCLIYQGTPFQLADKHDSQYREYLMSYSGYCHDNPQFQKGDKHHGPGPEFKYAREFHSLGGARVAWRLCDPAVETRLDQVGLFEDPWFRGLEMCLEEVECSDTEVDQAHQSPETAPVGIGGGATDFVSSLSVSPTPLVGLDGANAGLGEVAMGPTSALLAAASNIVTPDLERQTPVRSMLDLPGMDQLQPHQPEPSLVEPKLYDDHRHSPLSTVVDTAHSVAAIDLKDPVRSYSMLDFHPRDPLSLTGTPVGSTRGTAHCSSGDEAPANALPEESKPPPRAVVSLSTARHPYKVKKHHHCC